MGIEFAKGTDGKEDVCILVMPKESLTFCDWLEIARLMKWECNKDDLFIDPEVTDDDYWELTL